MGPVKGLGLVMATRTAAPGAGGGMRRQADDDRGALVRAAGDGDLAPVIFDDLFDGRQPEPGAGGLGGVDGVEDLSDELMANRCGVVLKCGGYIFLPARSHLGLRLGAFTCDYRPCVCGYV